MADRIISIISDWGETLGTGHFQRMLNLLWFLNQQEDIKAYFIYSKEKSSIPGELRKFFSAAVHPKSELIIRDKRDSDPEEIEKLKKISRVLVLDDLGEGREIADVKIDLLPNLKVRVDKEFYNRYFIYGYNFTRLAKGLKKTVRKSIDISVYYNPHRKITDFEKILGIFSDELKIVIFSQEGAYLYKRRGEKKVIKSSYAEIILSSRALLTYFGIMLFEASISGCRLITINPSKYHSKLTDLIKSEMNIINLDNSIYSINDNFLNEIFLQDRSPFGHSIDPKDVYLKIITCLSNFTGLIRKILDSGKSGAIH